VVFFYKINSTGADFANKFRPVFSELWDSINVATTGLMLVMHKLPKAMSTSGNGLMKFMKPFIEPFKKLQETFLPMPKLFDTDEEKIEKYKKKYEAFTERIKQLKNEQYSNKDVKNNDEIMYVESKMRFFYNRLKELGVELEPPDAISAMNDELADTDKLTNSVHNNLLKIGEDMQEAAFKSVLPDMSSVLKGIKPQGVKLDGTFSALRAANDYTGGESLSVLEVIKEEAIKQTSIFNMLLIESKKGVFR